VYLNYVNHANMEHGGGKVSVDSIESAYDPVHMDEARPAVQFNVITMSAGAAMSADPNSLTTPKDASARYPRQLRGLQHGERLVRADRDGARLSAGSSRSQRALERHGHHARHDRDVSHLGQPGGPIRKGECGKRDRAAAC